MYRFTPPDVGHLVLSSSSFVDVKGDGEEGIGAVRAGRYHPRTLEGKVPREGEISSGKDFKKVDPYLPPRWKSRIPKIRRIKVNPPFCNLDSWEASRGMGCVVVFGLERSSLRAGDEEVWWRRGEGGGVYMSGEGARAGTGGFGKGDERGNVGFFGCSRFGRVRMGLGGWGCFRWRDARVV